MMLQGMSFIAAILILNMEEADAFITFANLLNWPQLAAFFCMSESKVGQYLEKTLWHAIIVDFRITWRKY